MDKGKLKVLLHDLETVVESLKSEVYSDVDAYSTEVDTSKFSRFTDYDEIFEDDDE